MNVVGRHKEFDCPDCGTTYVDYSGLEGLKIGGKVCEDCDKHMHLDNIENVREAPILHSVFKCTECSFESNDREEASNHNCVTENSEKILNPTENEETN